MAELRGAVAELLLRHRPLVEDALYPLHEHAQLDELLLSFQRRMREMQQHEPTFWQQRVVQFIRRTLEAQVGARLLADANNADRSPAEESLENRRCIAATRITAASQSAEFTQAREQIRGAVQAELARLSALVDDAEPPKIAAHVQARPGGKAHFLELLWTHVTEDVCEDGQESIGEEYCFERDEVGGAQSYSFEAISFDDLRDECGSACR